MISCAVQLLIQVTRMMAFWRLSSPFEIFVIIIVQCCLTCVIVSLQKYWKHHLFPLLYFIDALLNLKLIFTFNFIFTLGRYLNKKFKTNCKGSDKFIFLTLWVVVYLINSFRAYSSSYRFCDRWTRILTYFLNSTYTKIYTKENYKRHTSTRMRLLVFGENSNI